MPRTDFLIVGGGIAGIALAVGLKKQGRRVLLVERDDCVRERFKGEFLQPTAVRVLTELGLGEIFDGPEAVAIRELRFRDLDADQKHVLSDVLIRYPRGTHAYSISSKLLVERLRDQAKRILGDSFITGAKVEFTNGSLSTPEFKLRTLLKGRPVVRRVKPRWVIGADGRSSTVRSWVGGKKAPANRNPAVGAQPELLIGAELKKPARLAHRYEVFRTQGLGTISLFSLSGQKQRVYWNVPASKAQSKKDWEVKLSSLFGEVEPLKLIASPQAELTHVSGAPADGVWLGPSARGAFLLAGDALAITTPLGGQGMTCALLHVSTLLSIFERYPASATRLGRRRIRMEYRIATRRIYRQVTLMNQALYYLCFSRSKLVKKASAHVFKAWSDNPELADQIARQFGGELQQGLNPARLLETLGVPTSLKRLAWRVAFSRL